MRRYVKVVLAMMLGIAGAVAPVAVGPALADAAGQVWPVTPDDKCLDADNSSPLHAGTKVQLWVCAGDASPQRWTFKPVGDASTGGGYWIITKGAYCLDADRKSINRNGTKVHMWPCAADSSALGYEANQVWYLWLSGRNRLLVNAQSRRCLDADTATAGQASAKVHLWDCAPGAPNQDWTTPVY